ncbi:MAG: TPR end-of-group domain-containing protein [Phycisphaerae bacterium]
MRNILFSVLLAASAGLFVGCARTQAAPDPNTPEDASPQSDAAKAEKIERLHEMVIAQYREGSLKQARATLKLILDLDETDARAWYNLACVETKLGHRTEGLDALTQAVEHGYSNADGMARDGDLAPLRKNHEKAFGDLLTRARQLQQSRELTEADKDTSDKEKFADARRIAAINRRLIPLFKEAQYAKAKALLGEILQIDPNNTIAHYNLACAYSRMEKPSKALDALGRSIQLGYSDFRHMQRDPDLAAIRGTEQYQEILQRKDEIQRARAERIGKQLRERFGDEYLYRISDKNKLVFATNTDKPTLLDMERYLTAVARAEWAMLFTHHFEQYVTIVIPKSGTLKSRRVGGFYSHSRRLLVAKTIGMELTHEFTHALHAADQDGHGQRHPIWITEGFATLMESSRLEDGRIVPEDNARLFRLKKQVKRKKHIPFPEFFKLSHTEFMKHQYKSAVAYGQTRYIMMYLLEKGLLKPWYDAYVAGYEDDETGQTAMEKVFGKDIDAIEKDWARWVRKRKNPPLRLRTKQGYIGIQTRGQVDGLRITRVVHDSGAHDAGVRPGEILTKVDGRRVSNSHALLRIVAGHDVGDTLKLTLRKDDTYRVVPVTLKAVPKKIPRSEQKPKLKKKIEQKKEEKQNPPAEKPSEKQETKGEKKKAA